MIVTTEQLIDSAKDDYEKGDFVVFIGAGISRLIGCMGWDDLAMKLIAGAFTPIECAQILGTVKNSKELITIAYNRFKQDKNLKGFYRVFNKAFKINKKTRNIYEIIRGFNCKFVTTNCDGLLEKALTARNYTLKCTKDNFNCAKPPHVFYLHGRYVEKNASDKKSLVFTVDSYLEKYSDDDFLNFLRNLFQKNTVLFLGYGLNEFELLDHLFTKAKRGENKLKKHYVLEGFYSHLPVLKSAKESYYDSLGINLLPYDMDGEGHSGQISVIEELVSKISEKTTKNAIIYESIVNLMGSYSDDNFNELMIYLGGKDGDNPFVDEFFAEVAKRPDYLQWLSACYKHDLFALRKCPPVETIKEGAYRGVRWTALSTLNRCLQKNKSDTELVELAASIVAPIISYVSGKKSLTDNFTVMGDLLDIVLNLSDSHITPDIIAFIKGVDLRWVHMDKSTLVNSNYINWSTQKLYKVLYCFLGYSSITESYRRDTSNLHQYQLECFLEDNYFSIEQAEIIFDVALALLHSLKDEYELSHIRLIESTVERASDNYYGTLIALVSKYFHLKINKTKIIMRLLNNIDDTFFVNLGFYLIRTNNVGRQMLFNLQFNPLDNTDIFTELYALLEHYKSELTKAEIDSILLWVKHCNMDVRENWEYRETFINTRKATVCYLLSEISEDANALCEEYKAKDIWEIKSPVEESKLYDTGGRVTSRPLFTSEEIPFDVGEAIAFLNEKYDYSHYFASESAFELLKYLKERFEQDSHIISKIVPELSDKLAAMVVGQLRQIKSDNPEWKNRIFSVYEEIVDFQLSKRDEPNEELIRSVIHAINFDEHLSPPTDRTLSLSKQLIDQRTRFISSNDPLTFPNYWNNMSIELFEFYITCLVKNASEIIGENSRILDENKAEFIALLKGDENQSFKYVVSEHVDQVVYLDEALIFDNLDNLFKVDNIVNLEACLSVMNKCRYLYSDISQFFAKNNVFNGLLKSVILNNEDVIRYDYHKGLCRYLIAGYSFEHYDFSVVKDFINICPASYYTTLVSETTSKKTSNAEIQYEKIFSNIFDAVFIKAAGNSKILHDVCSSALSIYRVVDKPSDSLFEKVEDCIEQMNEKEMYWHQISSFLDKYQPEYLAKMTDCIKKFLNKVRNIDLEKIENVIDGLVAIDKKDDAVKICNICISRRLHVKELASKLREL